MGAVDEPGFHAFCGKVRAVAVDGASNMFKVTQLLRRDFQHLQLRCRDRAHAVRTSKKYDLL